MVGAGVVGRREGDGELGMMRYIKCKSKIQVFSGDIRTFANKVISLLSDNILFLIISNNSRLNNNIKKWKHIVDNFERAINENIIHR